MRLKLLRRRLSVSAPRMTVRSRLPWPLRWVAFALMLGFCAALGLWAYEFGKDIAGIDRTAQAERNRLRDELQRLSAEHERALTIANSADTLLKSAKVAQDSLASKVKSLEAENLALMRDLAFFERLMPSTTGNKRLAVRGLQVDIEAKGRLRYQALLMQASGRTAEFRGRYEVLLSGQLAGQPWSLPVDLASPSLVLKQYQRLEGVADFPAGAVVKTVEVRVLDATGALQASEVARL
ncbi:MAG: DUF6776 family protein [Leptothrix sp. (in: b-proteobacteria)]